MVFLTLSYTADPDFSCGRTDGLTKVIQEVLADLKRKFSFEGNVRVTLSCHLMVAFMTTSLKAEKRNPDVKSAESSTSLSSRSKSFVESFLQTGQQK